MNRELSELIRTALITLIVALLIRGFVVEHRAIPSESMLPTIRPGDHVLVEKLTRRWDPVPARGSIVVFNPPVDADVPFIKRVVGLPGETVAVYDSRVWINGEPLPEPYLAEPPTYRLEPRPVPDGAIFVLGDNRNASLDSHLWGFLPLDRVSGQAFWRIWPLDRWGAIGL